MYVYLRDVHSNSRFARYDGFQIGSEEESYSLKTLGRYSGSAGDSLGVHRGMKFSTIDRDNTRSKANCAEVYGGGWWYNDCGDSDLTGKYFNIGKTDLNGILWKTWRKHVFPLSITKVTMSIVSKSQNDQIEREWQSYDRSLWSLLIEQHNILDPLRKALAAYTVHMSFTEANSRVVSYRFSLTCFYLLFHISKTYFYKSRWVI